MSSAVLIADLAEIIQRRIDELAVFFRDNYRILAGLLALEFAEYDFVGELYPDLSFTLSL